MTMRQIGWLYLHIVWPWSAGKRKRIIGMAVLICLVMIPLVTSLLFMDGMMNGITEKFILLQDGHLQIHLPFNDPKASMLESLEDTLYIQSIDPVITGYGILYSDEETSELQLKGVPATYFNQKRITSLKPDNTWNNLYNDSGNPVELMLSRTTAERLGVILGDKVAMMIVPDISHAVVRPTLGRVVSLYDSGYQELDRTLAFISLSDAEELFPSDVNNHYEVLTAERAGTKFESMFQTIGALVGEGIAVSRWDEFNTSVYENFITSRQVIFLVFVMIIIVASAYVSSIASEIVQDSMNEIALMKALGCTAKCLSIAYFLAVWTIVFIGLIIGALLAILIGITLPSVLTSLSISNFPGLGYYLLDFPVVIPILDIVMICLALLVLSSVTVGSSLRRIKDISMLQLLQQD